MKVDLSDIILLCTPAPLLPCIQKQDELDEGERVSVRKERKEKYGCACAGINDW
jgi:hypothetical protein